MRRGIPWLLVSLGADRYVLELGQQGIDTTFCFHNERSGGLGVKSLSKFTESLGHRDFFPVQYISQETALYSVPRLDHPHHCSLCPGWTILILVHNCLTSSPACDARTCLGH